MADIKKISKDINKYSAKKDVEKLVPSYEGIDKKVKEWKKDNDTKANGDTDGDNLQGNTEDESLHRSIA